MEVEGEGAVDPVATRLADLGRELMRGGVVSRRLLMEVSEGEFLEWCGLVVSYAGAGGWRKKEIQKNTRHVYTQRKFNLLREESEGYAKLVTLLNQAGAGAVTDATADAVVSAGCLSAARAASPPAHCTQRQALRFQTSRRTQLFPAPGCC